MSYYCPRGKNGQTKTIRLLGTVRSLFYQNTSSARKKLKKKKRQGHYFYKESMKNFSSGGNTDFNPGTKKRSDERFSVFYSP